MDRRTAMTALASAAVAGLAGGCASSTPVDPADTRLSVLFGHIDGKDAKINWVQVKQYGGTAPGYYLIDYDRATGVFFHVGIEPGDHQVHTFGNDSTHYNWAGQGRNATALRVDKPSAYFVGSYKFVRHDEGLFKADKFEMRRVTSPGEAEVLALVLRRMESDGELAVYAHQRGLVRQRLASLGSRRA